MKTSPAKLFGMLISTAAVICFSLSYSGCSRVGDLRTERSSIELADVEAVRAEIKMVSGTLQVESGTKKEVKTEFTYNLEALKPDVKYRVLDHRGFLVIRQTGKKGWKIGSRIQNNWKVHFHPEIPLDLHLVLSEGTLGDLRLSALRLTKLSFDVTSGEVSADVSGGQDDLARLDIETQSGSVEMKMAGRYAALTRIKALSESGDLALDMSGDWACDLDGVFRTSSGDVTLRLPVGIGVRVETSTGSGNIRASGLRQEQGAYCNMALGTSERALRLKVFTISGDINLLSAE